MCPGVIDNDMMASTHRLVAPGAEEQFKGTVAAGVPMKRYGTNEELAKMYLFLASDDSSYSIGGVYLSDGGITAGIM